MPAIRPRGRALHVARPMRPTAQRALVSVRWAVTSVRHVLRALPVGLIVALAAFHAWLLYASVSSGRVLDLDVAIRWVAGLALSGSFVALRRLGTPLWRGRKALVLWVLVAVLHASAVASRPATLEADDPVAQTLIALAVQLGGPLASAIGLVVVAWCARAVRPAVGRRLPRPTRGILAHLRAGGICVAAPRPPPTLA